MLRGFWLGVVLAMAGCGGAEFDQGAEQLGTKEPMPIGEAGAAGSPPVEPPVAICEPGRQAECPCPNGGKGAQSCNDDGSRWEPCMCANAQPPAPEKSPVQTCGPPQNHMLHPDDACPVGKPSNWIKLGEVAQCLAPFVASGVCAPSKGGAFYVCCPIE